MALECNHPNCTEATVCKGAREGEANTVIEKYECAAGHTFHETIEGVEA